MKGEKDDDAIDIVFSEAYQCLLKNHEPKTLISLVLHSDGVSVTRSTKLKMWLLSGVIIEIPPRLRNHRHNMVPISIWVSYVEPIANVWLQRSINNLNSIKTKATNFFFHHHVYPLDYRCRLKNSFPFFLGISSMNKNYELVVLAITGDCPAISLLLDFVNHNGYFSCWFCFIKSIYVNHKPQYYHQEPIL